MVDWTHNFSAFQNSTKTMERDFLLRQKVIKMEQIKEESKAHNILEAEMQVEEWQLM